MLTATTDQSDAAASSADIDILTKALLDAKPGQGGVLSEMLQTLRSIDEKLADLLKRS